MAAHIVALGTLTHQRFGSFEVVRVWCPYCGESHFHASSCDKHYAECPQERRSYYIRVVRFRTEFIPQLSIEILPVA
jgi:hypothetical protein